MFRSHRTHDFIEKKLARAFIDSVVLHPDTFIDLIHPEDEMYIHARAMEPKKEFTSYSYFNSGRECYLSLDNTLRQLGRSLSTVGSFLDFACGYGRVTRYIVQAMPAQNIWVSDIYTGAVDFQREKFHVNGFYSQTEPDQVKFPKRFDVIHVGSLFSHLPSQRFIQWLEALLHVLTTDGILIFSTHGPSSMPAHVEPDKSGFTFLASSESRSLAKCEYGSTFVSPEYVSHVAKKFPIDTVHYLEGGLHGYQDLYVITKKPTLLASPLLPPNRSFGYIDTIDCQPNGDLYATGWAVDSLRGAPVQEVEVFADNCRLGSANIGKPRPDVANHFKKSEYTDSGWEYSGSIAAVKSSAVDDPVIIKTMIRGNSGALGCSLSYLPR